MNPCLDCLGEQGIGICYKTDCHHIELCTFEARTNRREAPVLCLRDDALVSARSCAACKRARALGLQP